MATLIVAYQVARRLLPAWQALTAVAFIAFVPQHMAISASVNNDGLSELLIALLLWGALAYGDSPFGRRAAGDARSAEEDGGRGILVCWSGRLYSPK